MIVKGIMVSIVHTMCLGKFGMMSLIKKQCEANKIQQCSFGLVVLSFLELSFYRLFAAFFFFKKEMTK